MNSSTPLIGSAVTRIDGHLKVTGGAYYPSDMHFDHMVYAYLLRSTIARGKILHIETDEAEISEGVLAILTYKNALRLHRVPFLQGQPVGSEGHGLLPLQDDIIYYSGQPIGAVIAHTLEQARYAASLIRVEYQREQPLLQWQTVLAQSFRPASDIIGNSPDSLRGQPQHALDKAHGRVAATYTTPVEHHNPLAPLATVAFWENTSLTVYDATQSVKDTRDVLAANFGIPVQQVRVYSPFVGGAFGCGLRTWPHTVIAALAARHIQKPVKLVLTRQQMFTSVGHRPQTVQFFSLGADDNGTLTAITHQGFSQTSLFDEYVEPLTSATRTLYACPNVETTYRLVRANLGTPIFMRAPGEASGVFALESAMDELSYALHIDPLALRLQNYAEVDPETGRPWSSRVLRTCYQKGAEIIGWSQRSQSPGSMQQDGCLVGMGMASAVYRYVRFPAQAEVTLFDDGTALVQCGASDIGPGTYTILAQITADVLALPLSCIRVQLGDSTLPPAPQQGASATSASVGSAVWEAASNIQRQLVTLARTDSRSPVYALQNDEIAIAQGQVFPKQAPHCNETYSILLQRNHARCLNSRVESVPGKEMETFAMQVTGAQFARVLVDPDLGTLRVTHLVGVFGAGKILNQKTARSQMIGGVGMAVLEESLLDTTSGKFVNANLADYHIPVHADIPHIDVSFIEEHDAHVNPLGVKGVGEICIVGVAAAIANAVYHATGKRIRDLPIRLEDLL